MSFEDSAIERILSDKELLFREGEKSTSLYLITSGKINIYTVDRNNKEALLATFKPNQIIGEMAFVDGSPRSASARADGVTIVLELPSIELQKLLKKQPAWLRALLESLVVRLRTSKEKFKK